MSTQSGRAPVSVVVNRRVRVADAPAFEAGLRVLIETASRQPGQLSAEVLLGPSIADARDYYVIYRFADEHSLRSWEDSPTRHELLARLDTIAPDRRRRELTGLPWFDLPAEPPPSRHRMAILTWIGIWPIVSLLLRFAAPLLRSLPFLPRTAAITAAAVIVMTYLVMPNLARLTAPWLRSKSAGS